jgi:hypothetical protein
VLCLEALTNIRISDMPSGVRFVLDKARDLVSKKNLDPAEYGDDVGKYIAGENAKEAVRRFQSAYETAVRAEDADSAATRGWRSTIGVNCLATTSPPTAEGG